MLGIPFFYSINIRVFESSNSLSFFLLLFFVAKMRTGKADDQNKCRTFAEQPPFCLDGSWNEVGRLDSKRDVCPSFLFI